MSKNSSSPKLNPQKLARAELARETLGILEKGGYKTAQGWVSLTKDIVLSASSTRVISLNTEEIRQATLLKGDPPTTSVANETTQAAIARFGNTELCALNFASAKKPGGGFRNGAIAQEEDLTIASTLYPSLERGQEFYKQNKEFPSSLYLDLAIVSPNVTFFRNADWTLAENPTRATIVTCPAPNRTAIEENEPASLPQIKSSLERRIKLILLAAKSAKANTLILGAWGCGVFGNDPTQIAESFREGIKLWGAGIAKIHFAVLDNSADGTIIKPFQKIF